MDVIDLTKKGMSPELAYQKQKRKGAYKTILEQYKDPATVYAWMVLEERIAAGNMIKLDALRHLQDLRRQAEDDSFEYTYDLNKCRQILNFAATCPDVDTGKPLPLMMWQQAFLCKTQGWRDKNGEKRYKRVLFSVARTNGKTYLTNILLTYAFLVESEGLYNQDIGYIAPVTTQSKKGFSYIKTTFNYLASMPAFKTIFEQQDINVIDDEVRSKKTQDKLLRLSHESGKLDSFHFKLLVSDEAGDNERIGKIKYNNGKVTSGQVQVYDSQFTQISTAYPDSNSQLYQDERLMEDVMKHDSERLLDDYLCMVWEQDSLDETDNPELWEKSNPVLGLKDKHDSMLQSLISERDTKMADGSLAEFQNKNLNMWLQVKANSYLDLDDINNAVVQEMPIDIKGRDVFIGFDKSNFSDDSDISFVFPFANGKFFIYHHSWVPLARSQNNIAIKEKEDGINYRKSAERGFATIAKNEYGYIDDGAMYSWLLDFVSDNQLNVKFFCYDAWNTDKIILQLDQKTDWNLMPIRQGTKSLNEPTVEFRKQMDMGNIAYQDDEIIKASLKNAILVSDNNGIKVDKDKATAKIDFVDAVIDAFTQAMFYFDDIDPNYNDKDNSPFAGMSNDDINAHFKDGFSF